MSAREGDVVLRALPAGQAAADETEANALEALVIALYPWARRVALLLCRHPDDAEDLVQEAMLGAIRRPPSSIDPATFQAWLRTTMLRMHLRRRFRRRKEEQLTRLARRDAGSSADLPRVVVALGSLAPRQRACVVLFYYEDQSIDQIAGALGIRVGTVKAHLAQARERLRLLLD